MLWERGGEASPLEVPRRPAPPPIPVAVRQREGRYEMGTSEHPARFYVGDKVTIRTDPSQDSVQTCLSPYVLIAEVFAAAPAGDDVLPVDIDIDVVSGSGRSYLYRLCYPDGEPGNFGAPVLRERLERGWR